jgi:hypothetical protein
MVTDYLREDDSLSARQEAFDISFNQMFHYRAYISPNLLLLLLFIYLFI